MGEGVLEDASLNEPQFRNDIAPSATVWTAIDDSLYEAELVDAARPCMTG
jgi:hypothetical protein